jgi:hypothetical protein
MNMVRYGLKRQGIPSTPRPPPLIGSPSKALPLEKHTKACISYEPLPYPHPKRQDFGYVVKYLNLGFNIVII